jgi:nucleotide-binding universal stress UspA family protein
VRIAQARRGTDDGPGGFKSLLVGVDGSPFGRLALRAAVDLAILCSASIVGMTVCERSSPGRGEAAGSSRVAVLKSAAEEHARAAGVAPEHLTVTGHAAKSICDQARDAGVDQIALGATGLEQWNRPGVGSRAGNSEGYAEDGVRAEPLLVRRAVEPNQHLVERPLIGDLLVEQRRRNDLVHMADGSPDALAAEAQGIAVAKLQCLPRSQGGTRWHAARAPE